MGLWDDESSAGALDFASAGALDSRPDATIDAVELEKTVLVD